MSEPESYTVGWICALPVEYVAAQEFLDVEHEKPSFVSPNDTNDYTLGKIGEHNVAIAVLPDGEYGTASAANVATNMLNTFHNVRIGLMVGIGGGVPSESHDVRLGDVAVSAPRDDMGGVFQYDFGKSIQGQGFQHTRFLNQPPTVLRTAITGIQTQYERKGHRLEEAVNSILDKNARLRRKYERPESSMDRLFQPDVIHESKCGAESCTSDASNLVLRHERIEYEDNPAIHYGLIASANQLMKDALIRDRLATEKDVICFEMEAAGLLNTFPCLVIRGICDYSDSHKNKEWQGYAAMVAAAYAKDLLQRVPLNKIEAEEKISVTISDALKSANQRLDRAYDQQEQHYNEQKTQALTDQQQRCHQVFKISSYTEQKDINPQRADGTCQWALQSPEYTRWWGSNYNDLLWVSADPGCGKSVLARSIIDDYVQASSPKVTICYFFFKDNDEQNHLGAALCSVLHQLFSQRPHLLHYAIPSWEKNGNSLRQEVYELWRVFVTAASADVSCQTICIFDALDECREIDQDRLIEKFQFFHRQPCSSTRDTCLKFLVTSRPYDHIQSRFQAITDSFPHLHLKGEEENDQIHKEIDLVVKFRTEELAKTASLSWDIQQRLEHQLLQMEHRTYLWLHLAIDDIQSTFKNSLQPDEESIQMIPRSVDKAYEKILSRVPSSQKHTVRKILQIIIGARRPLTTTEMAMALGISISPRSQTAAHATLDSLQVDKKLRHLCGLFVFINNSKVYLIHQTAREFLIGKASSNDLNFAYSCSLSDTENQMARICMHYLLMEDLEDDEGESRSISRSFLEYSAVHWPDHVREMTLTSDQDLTDRLHRLYDTSGERFALWFPLFWEAAMPFSYVPKMNAMHLAAFNGHEQQVSSLITADIGIINTEDDTGTYPVIWASLNGHDNIAQMLLEQGADVNAQGGEYGNALQAACSRGHDEVAQMLLERGADVSAQGGEYGNALQAACSRGYDKIAQILLERGANVNAHGVFYGNALQAACVGGYDKIAQLLLERGADVNAQGGPYGNALQTACVRGYDIIVQILLEHGAYINAYCGQHGNALQTACVKGHDKIAQTLLERGADVNAQGGPFGNALQTACIGGYGNIAQMLLEQGADVNTQGGEYGNALQAACSRGHNEVAQMLLERGADVSAQGGEYGNALQAACSRGHDKIAQILLERGANVNAQGGFYGNALQAVCVGGYDKIAQLLLERGADVNAQGGPYGNALQTACLKGYDKIAQMLLERGTDINTQGGPYRNALQAACVGGYDKIAQILLERGADINIQGGPYGNALQNACVGGYDKIVQMLLDRGAEVNTQGGPYGNALQTACVRGHDKIVQALLERGADINTQGGPYGNALQNACVRGHDKVVQLLLERGADINAQGGEYGNSLQAACSKGHDEIAQILLQRGADVNALGGGRLPECPLRCSS